MTLWGKNEYPTYSRFWSSVKCHCAEIDFKIKFRSECTSGSVSKIAPSLLRKVMQKQSIPINPTILQWARLEAGLSLYEAASRAKITPPRKRKDEPALTAEDRLAAWEEGKGTPSLNQLENIASAYRRPLLTFFLAQPPQKTAAMADFRTVGNRPSSADTPEFAALRRRIILLHQELRALAEDAGNPKLSFVGSLNENTPLHQFVSTLRTTLGFTVEEQRRVRNEDAMFGYLRDLAQNIGIYVLLEGNVGSHHSNVSVEEFRGIALADELVPMVVVNPNDAKAAMVFTLVHELAVECQHVVHLPSLEAGGFLPRAE